MLLFYMIRNLYIPFQRDLGSDTLKKDKILIIEKMVLLRYLIKSGANFIVCRSAVIKSVALY